MKIKRSIFATIRIKGKCVVNGVKALSITLLRLNGIGVIPTNIKLVGTVKKRGNKLYGDNGVYTVVT